MKYVDKYKLLLVKKFFPYIKDNNSNKSYKINTISINYKNDTMDEGNILKKKILLFFAYIKNNNSNKSYKINTILVNYKNDNYKNDTMDM